MVQIILQAGSMVPIILQADSMVADKWASISQNIAVRLLPMRLF
jgi:hypothetical protein